MIHYLALTTEGNFADACMLDGHWFAGLFGYFPTYTLGALMAAQGSVTVAVGILNIDTKIEEGHFGPIVA